MANPKVSMKVAVPEHLSKFELETTSVINTPMDSTYPKILFKIMIDESQCQLYVLLLRQPH